MKNFLITGVSGYLGKRLVEELSLRDDIGTIVGIDINPISITPPGLVFRRMDIRDPAVSDLLREYRIDTVFHLAFVVKPIHDEKRMHDIDFNGTRNILDASLAARVGRVIAVSSTFAYGAHPDNPPKLREDAPLRGNDIFPYGRQKAVVDRMIQEFAAAHPEMIVTTLRPCTVFGPTIDNYVSRMVFRPFLPVIRGSRPVMQFVHEDDFVRACLAAMDKPAAGAFNIAGDGTLTNKEIARKVGAVPVPAPAWFLYPLMEVLWRLRIPVVETNRGVLEYMRYSFVADNEKAKKELDFHPVYSSAATLEDTVKHKPNVWVAPRKTPYTETPLGSAIPSRLLLLVFFLLGLAVSAKAGAAGWLTYIAAWAGSYFVVFGGACRKCPYYGKRCPVPLEGSCVHLFFNRGGGDFGKSALVWASMAYVMRIAIPVWVIVTHGLWAMGLLYFAVLGLFWLLHLRVTGCPHCINDQCPLNPEYRTR